MGRLAFEAVTTRDYNVVMAVATIAGVLNLAGLLLADIAYALVDPRISFEATIE
jgi:peptide/nickel transport system permease protein